jgi:TRAP-type C4-dicarboxylate transport system permease small subunit
MKRSYLIVISLLLLVLSIVLIIGGTRKSSLTSSALSFPDQIQLSSGETYQIPSYKIELSQPTTLIMGTISHVYVDIHPLGISTNTLFPLITEGFQVNLESKLEITNAQIAPSGLVHAALKSDQDTQLTWNITTDQSSSLSGTLWIYLAVQPKTSSSISEELPLFAIPLNIAVSTVLGLRADLALVIGIFGGLFTIAFLIVALRLNSFKQKTKKAK